MRYIISAITALFLAVPLSAQGSVSFSFNIGIQPAWGPTGYDFVEYYYLPDYEVYYYVQQRRYFYFENGRWVGAMSMPYRYRNVDLFTSYKIVLNERTPYRNHAVNRSRYASYRGRRDQSVIRDSRDKKYFMNENHSEHKQWQEQRTRSGNGRGNQEKPQRNSGDKEQKQQRGRK